MGLEKKQYADLLLNSFDKYIQIYLHESLEPATELLSYDFDFLENHKWHCHPFGKMMVESDLREITNQMNSWHNLLNRWHSWNITLEDCKDNDDVWNLESEFVELIINKCLFMPSAIRDVFTTVGIENFHQVRLSIDKEYKDQIDYDPTLSKSKLKKRFVSRGKKEEIFAEILEVWDGENLLECIKSLNQEDYRQLTKNFRNLSSHGIAPRITIGQVSFITRSVSQAVQVVGNDDGTKTLVEVSDKTSVSYGFGGIEPLNRVELFKANLSEFKKARECYLEFRKLLENSVNKIPLMD